MQRVQTSGGGIQQICPMCSQTASVAANSCPGCGFNFGLRGSIVSGSESGLARASLILGVLSIPLLFVPFVSIFGNLMGLAAIVLGCAGFRQDRPKAIVGIACGSLPLAAIIVVGTFLNVFACGACGPARPSLHALPTHLSPRP